MELISCHKMFDGEHRRYRHVSKAVQSEMTFAVYLPKQALKGACLPVLYYLSGLTCNDENFSTKSGAQQYAAKYGIILVIPDTSPRGETVPDDEAYDLGQGAGFYVNATASPWSVHYQMYDYIVDELPRLIEKHFNVGQKAICGHSMGGHGALQIGLKNPDAYASISAFAPIVNPSKTPWGQKAFTAYLGEKESDWCEYDSTYLVAKATKAPPIYIDQGLADDFYPNQLQPEQFVAAAQENGINVELNLHDGYDHSYFFVASFIEVHIKFHANHLNA